MVVTQLRAITTNVHEQTGNDNIIGIIIIIYFVSVET